MKPNLIVVRAAWDEAAGVWVAQSDDIGLVTEAATLEALRERVPAMIVDLLECYGESGSFDIPVNISRIPVNGSGADMPREKSLPGIGGAA